MGTSHKRKRPTPALVITALIGTAGLCLIAYGAWGAWQRYQATHKADPSLSTDVVTHSTATPDETKPTKACQEYKVAPNLPRRIQIASIGVDACIERVGIDQHGAVAVPTNIHVAGYFIDSPPPGASGISIIDGHVLGRYDDAVFKDLDQLPENAEIRIQRGDYSWLTFTVADVREYPESETMEHATDALDFSDSDPVKNQLSLITCAGTYDRSSNSYDKRIVVRAKYTGRAASV